MIRLFGSWSKECLCIVYTISSGCCSIFNALLQQIVCSKCNNHAETKLVTDKKKTINISSMKLSHFNGDFEKTIEIERKSINNRKLLIITYTNPVATIIKKKPRKIRRHVSCFLSNGWERPPQAPAHRQQQTHNL